MYKTTSENLLKIINCMRPTLLHVVRPWGLDDSHGTVYRDLGYSVINLDMENWAFPERIREKIERRLSGGRVVTYGIPRSLEDLEHVMPDEFVLVWIYPNKQTDYYTSIKRIVFGRESTIETKLMPPNTLDFWKSYLQKSDDSDLRRITKAAHAHQKREYDQHCVDFPRMLVVLV
jgi:hypothetical protein